MLPVLGELARELGTAKIVKVNVFDHPQLATDHGVATLPTFLAFKKGQVTAKFVGMTPKRLLLEALESQGK